MGWLRNVTPKGSTKIVDADKYLHSDTVVNVIGQVSKRDFLPKGILNNSEPIEIILGSFSNGFSEGFS